MPKAKDGRLTIKQRKFVKEYVKNDGNGTKAALAVYDTTDDKTAGVIAVENLAKPSIAQAIELALDKADITLDKAIQPIADGLQASRWVGDADNGGIEVIDHSTRLKASSMALKLLGADKQEAQASTTYNFMQINNGMKSKYDD